MSLQDLPHLQGCLAYLHASTSIAHADAVRREAEVLVDQLPPHRDVAAALIASSDHALLERYINRVGTGLLGQMKKQSGRGCPFLYVDLEHCPADALRGILTIIAPYVSSREADIRILIKRTLERRPDPAIGMAFLECLPAHKPLVQETVLSLSPETFPALRPVLVALLQDLGDPSSERCIELAKKAVQEENPWVTSALCRMGVNLLPATEGHGNQYSGHWRDRLARRLRNRHELLKLHAELPGVEEIFELSLVDARILTAGMNAKQRRQKAAEERRAKRDAYFAQRAAAEAAADATADAADPVSIPEENQQ